jgi:hypothetical protein
MNIVLTTESPPMTRAKSAATVVMPVKTHATRLEGGDQVADEAVGAPVSTS